MKKLSIIAIAAMFLSCSPNSHWVAGKGSADYFRQARLNRNQVMIAPNQPVAFKEIEDKNIILTEKPAPNDLITITVKKQ